MTAKVYGKLHHKGAIVPESENARERLGQTGKEPGSESSRERISQGSGPEAKRLGTVNLRALSLTGSSAPYVHAQIITKRTILCHTTQHVTRRCMATLRLLQYDVWYLSLKVTQLTGY